MICGQGHLTQVCKVISCGNVIIDESFVKCVEKIFQLGFLPDCISSKKEIVLILPPIYISDRKVIIFGHFQRSTTTLNLSGLILGFLLNLICEGVNECIEDRSFLRVNLVPIHRSCHGFLFNY